MTTKAETRHTTAFSFNKLFWAIAAQSLFAAYSQAAPTGGSVVGGDGSIVHSGSHTQINQNSDRMAINWDTFNVGAGERVQYIQPGAESLALNRILDHNPSSIMGRIDANGRVILSNPNGVIFGSGSTVNVQSLVASGLDINVEDFMAGELAFKGVDGTDGVVISSGIINAATGGNVALLGKTVTNNGLIKAELGRVALASGNEVVLTFDEQGLLGVRIDEAALEEDAAFAVTNAGTVKASGGKVLLSASVSEDLFSSAVNHGNLNGNVEAIVHDDGSFSLGSGGGNVSSRGTINVSTVAGSAHDGGQVIVAGEKVVHKGFIRANAQGDNLAGNVQIQAVDSVVLSNPATVEARNPDKISGRIKIDGNSIEASGDAKILTTGNAIVYASENSKLPQINAHHGYIAALSKVTQNRNTKTSGNLHINSTGSGDINLTHNSNDFNSVSATVGHSARVKIVDKNDVVLGDLDVHDGKVSVTSLGAGATISQTADSTIHLDASDLSLKGDRIVLGSEGGQATTGGYGGMLTIDFEQSVDTNSSIAFTEDEFYPSYVSITGNSDGTKALTLTGNGATNLAAQINGESLTIDHMSGQNATLSGLFETSQTGAIHLTDTLTWNSYQAVLDHAGNDVGALAGTGAIAFGRLNYVDSNDVDLKNLDTSAATENEVSIASLGDGGRIRQLTGTTLAADFIELQADNVELGAGGHSEVRAGYLMDVQFGQNFLLDGTLTVGGYAPFLKVVGDETDNTFTIGENINYNIFDDYAPFAVFEVDLGAGNDTATFDGGIVVDTSEADASYAFDMGDGNDRVYLNNHMTLPITLGDGPDHVEEYQHGTVYELVDFNSDEDSYDIIHP